MKHCHSSKIVKFIDIVETNSSYYIVQEFCESGDMQDYLDKNSPLNEQTALNILTSILEAFIELQA